MFIFKKNTPTTLYSQTRLQQMPVIPVLPSDYSVLEKPQNYHARLLELIATADKRIMMTMLYLQNDEAGNEVLSAIKQRLEQNKHLHVTIYVDFHRAQRGLIGKNQDIMINSDFYHNFFKDCENPPAIYGVPVKKREIFGVLHLKGFVFDDTLLYTGASINNVYLNFNHKYRLDRYHEIKSKALADSFCTYANEAFHLNFAVQDFTQGPAVDVKEIRDEIKQLRRHLTKTQYKFKSDLIVRQGQIGITPLVGLGKNNNNLNKTILWLLAASKQELFICTPYFNLPKIILKSLDDALERGVKITICAGDKVANDFFIHDQDSFSTIGAIPYIYEQNLYEFVKKRQAYIDTKQLRIRLWQDGLNTYHLKGIYADRALALITGNNLNPRAWGLDLENALLVHDPQFLMQEKFKHEQQYILLKTREIKSCADLQTFDEYPDKVKNILTKVKRFKASLFIKQLL